MKFIITESQYNRLLTEQKVYTSQTEYDKAMLQYEKDLKQYDIDYKDYNNKLNKWKSQVRIIPVNGKKIPIRTSPGRVIRFKKSGGTRGTLSKINFNQTTIPTFKKKKPIKPILKLPVTNTTNISDVTKTNPSLPSNKITPCDCSDLGVKVEYFGKYMGFELCKDVNKDSTFGCKNGKKYTTNELIDLKVLKYS